MVTEDQIKKFLDDHPDLKIDTLYRMIDGDRRDRRRGNVPRRQMALEKAEYADKAERDPYVTALLMIVDWHKAMARASSSSGR